MLFHYFISPFNFPIIDQMANRQAFKTQCKPCASVIRYLLRVRDKRYPHVSKLKREERQIKNQKSHHSKAMPPVYLDLFLIRVDE